ncbi:MAG: glycosyltransferase, partial [Bacteroidota bacterium]
MIKKEITLLISSLRGGGAESVCTNIANGLANREWSVNLVVLNMNGSIFHDRLNQKVNLISLNINHARYSFMALSKYLFKQKPSVIMSFNYELTVSAILIKNVLGVKTKIIARNNNTLTQKTKQTNGIWVQKIVNPMIKRFYSQSDHIINQCEGMKEDLLSFYPNSKLKLSTIYNPVNTNIENLAKTIDFNK